MGPYSNATAVLLEMAFKTPFRVAPVVQGKVHRVARGGVAGGGDRHIGRAVIGGVNHGGAGRQGEQVDGC